MTDNHKILIGGAPSVDRRRVLALSTAVGAGTLLASVTAANAQCAGEDTFDKIKRTGEFNLGAREAAPPYGFKDKDGNWNGFATEIARAVHAAVEKEAGKPIKLNYIPVTSQTRIPLLQNGTIDMEAGATVVTKARVKVVSFAVSHFVSSTAFIVAADGPIQKLEDLSGKRLGYPSGGGEGLVKALVDTGRIKPPGPAIGFPDHPQGFTALETGSIEAYVTEGPLLYGISAKSTNPKKWKIIEPNVDGFQQAMPIRPDGVKFKRIADLAVVDLFRSGEWQKLYDKYFGSGTAAPLPMNDLLRSLAVLNSWPD
jgi:ABC-type amino acid transport substrate-binding protein